MAHALRPMLRKCVLKLCVCSTTNWQTLSNSILCADSIAHVCYLCLFLQDPGIAAAAAQFTRALAPALFADAADQCCRRYLGAQSIVRPALWITAVATLMTPLYLHLFCKW